MVPKELEGDVTEEDKFEWHLKEKNRIKGTALFVGELAKRSLLKRVTVFECADRLAAGGRKDYAIEALAQFWQSLGPFFDGTDHGKIACDTYMEE
eukprot:Polyplicarium_translucidae@DN2868_c1_g1_i5.p1